MDAFSEILSGVKLNGAVFFTAEFSAPWGLSVPAPDMTAAILGLGAAHLLLYHLLVEGGAVIELTDGQCTELKPGDIVIFPRGDPHPMSSGKGAKPPFPNYGITASVYESTCLVCRHSGGSTPHYPVLELQEIRSGFGDPVQRTREK